MNNRAAIVEEFKAEIWEHGRFREGRGGMGGYGERFTFHRGRYEKLTEEERRLYETAVLDLILDENPTRAEVGITLCEVLQDYGPPLWLKRVSGALEAIQERALPTEEGDFYLYLPMALLACISSLGLKEFGPALRVYARQITQAFNQGKLSLQTWDTLYRWTSRALVRFSCEDAKDTLTDLSHQDDLLARLDRKLDGLLSEFFFESVSTHGFECGRELVNLAFSSANPTVAKWRGHALSSALQALEKWKYLKGRKGADEFKDWANKYLET
jgi:hypothetical protein